MKQKNYLKIEFNPVKLHLNDFIEIESYLKELPDFQKITISIKDYEFDSFSEIIDIYNESNDLIINVNYGKHRSLTISFGTYRNTISDYDPSLEVRGVIQKISTLLDKNERSFLVKLKNFCKYYYWIGMVAMFVIGIFYGFDKITTVIFFSALISASFAGFYGLYPLKSNFLFINKKEKKSFLETNKDPIIVGVIVNLIVAIFSFLLGKNF